MVFEYKGIKKNARLPNGQGINYYVLFGELIDRSQAVQMLTDIDNAIAAGENKILLNLVDLKYINSSGLNILINILTKARKAGGDVAICNVNKKITELLVITKLNSVFNVSDSEEKAEAILNK